ncbi:hypothetical protein [Microtetraspora malaysiensis]|uniref:Carboxypeptidase regulatory-like domain-containing protein n=1 Tax=Microtetraspora malaysiensis TaxID=161358 RepID=A0ABW6T3L5_9ACTN
MRRPLLLLTWVIAAFAVIMSPQAATAGQSQITINWSNSHPDDLGKLRISATSTYPIAAFKAHVMSDSGQELATAKDFALTSGTDTNGVWTTRSRIQIAELGLYGVTVEATDSEGNHITAERVGNLTYMAKTEFAPFKSDRATVNYSRRDVIVSGRLLGRWPGTGESKPLAGRNVTLTIAYLNRDNGGYDGFDLAELTTDADGRFSHPITLQQAAEFSASYYHDSAFPGYLSGISDKLVVGVHESATQIKIRLSSDRINAGDQLTVSGTARWHSPDGWRPLADTALTIGIEYGSGGPIESVTTDANGRFSMTLTPYTRGTVSVGFYSEDPYKAHATETATFVVVHPAAFTDFTAQRAGADVAVSGHLAFSGTSAPAAPEAVIEFSADGQTWTERTVLRAWWDGRGYAFSGSIPEPGAGQWRARFLGGGNFQDAVSQTVSVDAAP